MRCGQVLFKESDLTPHVPTAKGVSSRGLVVACTSLFLQELPESLQEKQSEEGAGVDEPKTEGKFKCPKCNARVGHWNWSGLQCSCGSWVTPAFQITSSKVDLKIRTL